MIEYLALLRAVNVGGKNKVTMSILKQEMQTKGFQNVITYINSGNILFDSEFSKEHNTDILRSIIKDSFNLDIDVIIVSTKDLEESLSFVPVWWHDGNKEVVHNALFLFDPKTRDEMLEYTQNYDSHIESVFIYEDMIFWSANRPSYTKTKLGKLGSTRLCQNMTIRNSNTVHRLIELAKK